jgi:hypothetical protein
MVFGVDHPEAIRQREVLVADPSRPRSTRPRLGGDRCGAGRANEQETKPTHSSRGSPFAGRR